jgi:hypothetical protein
MKINFKKKFVVCSGLGAFCFAFRWSIICTIYYTYTIRKLCYNKLLEVINEVDHQVTCWSDQVLTTTA